MIRNATTEDVKSLFRLYKRVSLNKEKLSDPLYRASIQRSGFLLGGDTEEDMKRLIEQSVCFLVYEQRANILGFAIASTEKEYKDDQYKIWFDKNIKQIYYRNTSVSLLSIAVDPEVSGKGVAGKLLYVLEQKLKLQEFCYLFPVIAISPITNCPSFVFHEKHGFERIATGIPRKLFGLCHYASVLLYKKL